MGADVGAAALGANAGEELGLSREPREKRPPFFLLGSVEAVGGGLGALRRKNICAAWCRTPLAAAERSTLVGSRRQNQRSLEYQANAR